MWEQTKNNNNNNIYNKQNVCTTHGVTIDGSCW
jgi:hypothetical protein